MIMKRITLRDENGNVVESKKVTEFKIENIPSNWTIKHNYSIWFSEEDNEI